MCDDEIDIELPLSMAEVELPTMEIKVKKEYYNKHNMQTAPMTFETVKVKMCPDCLAWWLGLATGDEPLYKINEWLNKINETRAKKSQRDYNTKRKKYATSGGKTKKTKQLHSIKNYITQ